MGIQSELKHAKSCQRRNADEWKFNGEQSKEVFSPGTLSERLLEQPVYPGKIMQGHNSESRTPKTSKDIKRDFSAHNFWPPPCQQLLQLPLQLPLPSTPERLEPWPRHHTNRNAAKLLKHSLTWSCWPKPADSASCLALVSKAL